MAVHIKVRLIGLPLGFEQRRRLLQECRGQFMGPGFHGNSHIQRSVDLAVILSGRRGLYSEDADANAVEAEFDVVGPGEAFDMLVAVAASRS